MLPIVDSHMHLWDLRVGQPAWLVGAEAGSIEADIAERFPVYDVPAYLADLAPVTVSASVHVQAEWDHSDPVAESRWLQESRAASGKPTAFVAHARLERSDVANVLSEHASYPGFRGVRQLMGWAADPSLRSAPGPDTMGSTAWRRGFSLLEPMGLSFDLAVYPAQLADAAALARAFPTTLIALNHMGCPDEDGSTPDIWLAGLRELALEPNVYCKVSGITSPHRSAETVRERIEAAIDTFGCDRSMFGSNLPIERAGGSLELLIEAATAVLASRTDAERTDFWSGTATRFYRLEE